MSHLARWWRWLVARYHLVGYREAGVETGRPPWQLQQRLYWHRSYREASHGQ